MNTIWNEKKKMEWFLLSVTVVLESRIKSHLARSSSSLQPTSLTYRLRSFVSKMVLKNELPGVDVMSKSDDICEAPSIVDAWYEFSHCSKVLSTLPGCLLEISKQAQLPRCGLWPGFLDYSGFFLPASPVFILLTPQWLQPFFLFAWEISGST